MSHTTFKAKEYRVPCENPRCIDGLLTSTEGQWLVYPCTECGDIVRKTKSRLKAFEKNFDANMF